MSGEQKQTVADVRQYKIGDEDGILRLFEQVFGKTCSDDEWRWKFAENPYRPPLASLALGADGEIVAQYTLLPLKLNVMGRPVLAGQSIDTMVDEKRRGEQLFERTAKECYEQFKGSEGKLVYGFPNDNSYPGFMRKLGWKRIGYLMEYSYRAGISDLLKKIFRLDSLASIMNIGYQCFEGVRISLIASLLKLRISAPISFRTTQQVPAGLDALWASVKSYSVFSVWKDAEYFSWRYDRNTKHKFTYFCLERGDELIGLAVVAESQNGESVVSELIVKDRDVLVARLLLTHVMKATIKADVNILKFSGIDAGFFDAAFSDFKKQTNFGLVFCAHSIDLPEIEDMIPLKDNWTITLGDSDVL